MLTICSNSNDSSIVGGNKINKLSLQANANQNGSPWFHAYRVISCLSIIAILMQ